MIDRFSFLEHPLSRRRFVKTAGKLTLITAACTQATARPVPARAEEEKGPFTREIRTITQPVDHAHPHGPSFTQYIHLLIPDGADESSPFFFILGNEHDVTSDEMIRYYKAYQTAEPIIFIQPEHRGYGQSITEGDQTIPSYVTIDQALADYHRVVMEFRGEFTGPWMAVGYSYGGGLVINYAHSYPDDVDAILSSSGVVDWPFAMDVYDRQVRLNLGDDIYTRVAGHIEALAPDELFDDNWVHREFLTAWVTGMTQYDEYSPYVGLFGFLSRLSTERFLKALRALDDSIADGKAMKYAVANAMTSMPWDVAHTGEYTWRVWRYQQAIETGVFWLSSEADGPTIYPRTEEDFIAECEGALGFSPPYAKAAPWSPRDMVPELKVPMVYVIGGRDPWKGICLESDFPINEGRIFLYNDRKHCPERRDPKLGGEVIAELLSFARK
ncbi:MAG: alpha/beta fold hydrolase [Deltaproteobacteria bacterium]|nr:alpha/beta fold hydrolase [Candidatus Zymogenaceae bacterium]